MQQQKEEGFGTLDESRTSYHRVIDSFMVDQPGQHNFAAATQQGYFYQQNLENRANSKKLAYQYMLGSALCMALNALCVKELVNNFVKGKRGFVTDVRQNIPPFELLFLRSGMVLIIIYIYTKFNEEFTTIIQTDKANKKLIILLSFIAFLLGYVYFKGISKMPLSEAIVIIYTSPIFTGLLGKTLLKEPFTNVYKVGAILSVIGLFLIIRPFFYEFNQKTSTNYYDQRSREFGGLISLIGAFLISVSGIAIRLVGRLINPLTIMIFQTLSTLIISPIMIILFEDFVWPTFTEYILIIIMGVSNFFGQFAYIKGIQLTEQFKEHSLIISLVNYAQMLFAFIFDFGIIGDQPEVPSVLGMLLIIAGCIYIVMKQKQ